MNIVTRWLGLERGTFPVPAEFQAFMEHHFPHRIELARAELMEGGGLRIAIKFKNGRELTGEVGDMADMDEFLGICGMVYDL